MKIEHIVVPVDFSECSQAALRRACVLGEHFGAKLHLLHAIPPIPYPAPVEFGVPTTVYEDVERAAAAKLEEWADEAAASGLAVTRQTTQRRPIDSICDPERVWGGTIIVMGSHGHRGLKHLFLGSIAEATLRSAPCPTLVVKETPDEAGRPIRRILVCTDFSEHAEHATDLAIALAASLGAELHLAHAIQPIVPLYAELPPPQAFMDEVRDAANKKLDAARDRVTGAGLDGTVNLLEGDVPSAMLRLTERHPLDLVVTGTRGNTGLKHVALGSVAERVTRLMPCSVLVARAGQAPSTS